jgi:hypothetical protein
MPTKETVYKLFTADSPADVPLLANWLQANGRGTDSLGVGKAVAVALHYKRRRGHLAFATPNEVITLDLRSPMAEALLGVCRSVLLDHPQIDLRCRDMYRDLVDLTQFFGKELQMEESLIYQNLAPAMVGDLRQAANLIGLVTVPKTHFKQAADDAYEVALYGPQYEYQIAPYYNRVSLPYARLQAEGSLFRNDLERYDWWVGFPDLWLRVFTHFSRDPTLSWAFQEDRDVRAAVAGTLKITETQAHSLLMWQAHDREMAAFSSRCPQLVDALPADLPNWARQLDLHYPTLCASTIQMRQAYWESRAAHTLYGRMLRPGHSPGEASAFRIFGTVEDIVAVAAVSYWQARTSTDIRVTRIEGGPDAQQIRIKGEGPSAGKNMWKSVLEPIAGLNNPMSVSLAAQVVLP